MHTGIETRLDGTVFRSRLEARWAAVFDRLGWRWEYEPIDLAGYIPDFVLMFEAGPVLVEIKPKFTVHELQETAARKIDNSGWESENSSDALILGAAWYLGDGAGEPVAGPLRQTCEAEPIWGEGAWITCAECDRPSIYQWTMGWECIRCGAGGKVYHGGALDLQSTWNEAGEIVRWKGRRR